MDISVETITPALAADWLAHNRNNRHASRTRVALYAKQMRAGQWHLTGDPVRFNGSDLIDGQHRLLACVEADVPFISVVMRGVEPDAMHVIDTGLNRTLRNLFELEGITRPSDSASASRWLLAWDGGYFTDGTAVRQITRDDLVAYYREHADEVNASMIPGDRLYESIGGSRVAWLVLHVLLARADSDRVSDFYERATSGAYLAKGDPILAFRAWAMSPRTRPVRHDVRLCVVQGIRTWNAWTKGRHVRLLKSWTRKDLPVPVGGQR